MRHESDEVSHLTIEVLLKDPAWRETFSPAAALGRKAAAAALATLGCGPADEVSIVLADDAFVRRLNRDYRGEDSATNVLAFPGTSENGEGPTAEPASGPDNAPRLLGDVVLAHETVVAEATEQGKRLGDHLAHLVVHGVLHLFGYDHHTDAEAVIMERLEARILATLAIEDPYRPVRRQKRRALDEKHERPIQ